MTTDSNDELVSELTRVRAENARLSGLLETHGIAWHASESMAAHAGSPSSLSTHEKVALFGRLQRANLIGELNALPPDAPRVLLATGKLVGEGFDHPPLDTLVLAMPISWKGTLQQYAGRLHREHADKTRVHIIDFVDTGHPALRRMWDKRQRGYQAMGYRVPAAPVSDNLDFGAVAPDEVAVAKPP